MFYSTAIGFAEVDIVFQVRWSHDGTLETLNDAIFMCKYMCVETQEEKL